MITEARPKGNKVAYSVIGVFVAICAVGWAIIMAHSDGTPGISPQVVSWRAEAQSVRVHYTIAKSKGANVACTLIAVDPDHAVVGRVQVTAPAGHSDVETRRDVPTTAKATSIDIRDCHTA